MRRFDRNEKKSWDRTKSKVNAKYVREQMGLSQSEFSSLLGVSLRTLQEWEQARRMPTGPALSLLRIAEQSPRALLDLK